MRAVDRLLQRWRIAKALPWVPTGGHVLDVGCGDGALFRQGRHRIGSGVGADLLPAADWVGGPIERRTGAFPDVLVNGDSFDAIVMLAVVEHVDETTLKQWATRCVDVLRPGGRLVITVPSPAVDDLLHIGMRLRLLDGMEAHQHHGFRPGDVPDIFGSSALVLEHLSRFQLGLNNLFVFRR